MAWSAGAILTAAQLNTYVPQAWSAWTPTVTAATGTFTTVSGSGRYIQMGKTVLWYASITITTVGTASGHVLFTLPVALSASMGVASSVGSGREGSVGGKGLTVFVSDSTHFGIANYDNTSAIAAGHGLFVHGTYEAA